MPPRATLIKIILGAAALIVAVLIGTWLAGGFLGLSAQGIGALTAGIAGSLLLGIGLMSLVFASSRSGHDQASYDATKSHFKDPPHKGP